MLTLRGSILPTQIALCVDREYTLLTYLHIIRPKTLAAIFSPLRNLSNNLHFFRSRRPSHATGGQTPILKHGTIWLRQEGKWTIHRCEHREWFDPSLDAPRMWTCQYGPGVGDTILWWLKVTFGGSRIAWCWRWESLSEHLYRVSETGVYTEVYLRWCWLRLMSVWLLWRERLSIIDSNMRSISSGGWVVFKRLSCMLREVSSGLILAERQRKRGYVTKLVHRFCACRHLQPVSSFNGSVHE